MNKERQKQSRQRLRKVLDDRQRRIRLLLARGLIQDAAEIPANAIPIDADQSTMTKLCVPQLFYEDIEFTCSDCGRPDFWSAGSQQYYFEVTKASPYNRPKRCYDCRQKELKRKLEARASSEKKD